nr:MAG TPA: hypothetical protein [Bacteriophage sp.]
MLTKANRSLYVTIFTSSFLKESGSWRYRPFGSPGRDTICQSLKLRIRKLSWNQN